MSGGVTTGGSASGLEATRTSKGVGTTQAAELGNGPGHGTGGFQVGEETFEGVGRYQILSLVARLDSLRGLGSTTAPATAALLPTLGGWRFVHTFNLGKANLAQGTGVLPIGPGFDTPKAEHVLAFVELGNLLAGWHIQADGAVLLGLLLLVCIFVVGVIGAPLFLLGFVVIVVNDLVGRSLLSRHSRRGLLGGGGVVLTVQTGRLGFLRAGDGDATDMSTADAVAAAVAAEADVDAAAADAEDAPAGALAVGLLWLRVLRAMLVADAVPPPLP